MEARSQLKKLSLKHLFLTLTTCTLLVLIYEFNLISTEILAWVFLTTSYGLFLLMLLATTAQRFGKPILVPFYRGRWWLTLLIGVCTISILDDFSHDTAVYIPSTGLAYGLLTYHIVLILSRERPLPGKYIIHGLLIVAVYFMSPTMDQSDPYGPHFQLRVVFWLLLAHMILGWFLDQWKLTKQLKNDKAHAELQLLKSQINPHFLFNTLNNIYGLALEKSDQTPEMIMGLSEMMRYSLYQGSEAQVPLQAEINYLDNYLALNGLRWNHRGEVGFHKRIDREDYTIAPLLLIVLVENAFKHGFEPMRGEASVEIALEVEAGELNFSVTNTLDPNRTIASPGLGLDNLRKRLELIYPSRYNLQVSPGVSQFKVDLKIHLEPQS